MNVQLPSMPAGDWQQCAGTCGGSWRPHSIDSAGLCPDCAEALRLASYQGSAEHREKWMCDAGVPAILRQPFLSRLAARAADATALRDAAAWAGDPALVLVAGPVGSGKSMFSVELAWRLRRPTRWISAADAVDLELAHDESERYQRDQVRRAGCLVLDDMGVGTSGAGWGYLLNLVSRRHANCLPTIITCMVGLDEIPSPALVDRLRDALIVPFHGGSLRGG